MDELNLLGPTLDPSRLARRKEHLMSEIKEIDSASATRPAKRWTPKRLGVAIAAAAVLGLGVGIPVAADSLGVWRDDSGVIGIDGQSLSIAYKGRIISVDQLEELNGEGRAMFGVSNAELACQSISLYFDSDTEADSYQAGFMERERARKEARRGPAPAGDVCDEYASAPRFVTTG